MRGAFGKPLGTVARVDIGQPLLSVRTYDKHKDSVIEALRRTKFKFPGRQKVIFEGSLKKCLESDESIFSLQIYVSKKWGFTKWDREDFEKMRQDGRLHVDGSNVLYLPEHGPLSRWCKVQAELAGM